MALIKYDCPLYSDKGVPVSDSGNLKPHADDVRSVEELVADILAYPWDFEVRLSDGTCAKHSTYPKFQIPASDYYTATCLSFDYYDYTFENKEEQMYVFDVVVVNKENDSIVLDGRFVASTSEVAKMRAMAQIMRDDEPSDETIANFHFVVVKVGEGYSK